MFEGLLRSGKDVKKEPNSGEKGAGRRKYQDVRENRSYRLRMAALDTAYEEQSSQRKLLSTLPPITTSTRRAMISKIESKDDINIRITPTHASKNCSSPFENSRRSFFSRKESVDDINLRTTPTNKSLECGPFGRKFFPAYDISDGSSKRLEPLPRLETNAQLIFNGPCLVWRRNIRCDIVIFEHNDFQCYEVILIDLDRQAEISRMYLSIQDVNDILDETVDTAVYRQREINRREVITEARKSCAIEFISASLRMESEAVDGLNSTHVISCGRYDADAGEYKRIDISKPKMLIPAKYKHKFHTIGRRHSDVVAAIENLLNTTSTLTKDINAASEHAQISHSSLGDLKRIDNKVSLKETHLLNPRVVYWRLKWKWAIRQVIIKNKIARTMGGAWARAVFARKTHDLALLKHTELSKLKKVGNFRKLAVKSSPFPGANSGSAFIDLEFSVTE